MQCQTVVLLRQQWVAAGAGLFSADRGRKIDVLPNIAERIDKSVLMRL